jgi:tetratricopeptide (TPR) repeat protein
LLAADDDQLDLTVRADALNALGSLTYWQRDYLSAQRCYQQALAIHEERDVPAGIALAHYNLGFTAVFTGTNDAARRHFSQALNGYDNLADRLGSSRALAGLALVDRMTGNHESAQQRATQALAEQHLIGDELGATNTLGLLGSINARVGRLDDADTMLREALVSHDRVGNVSGIVWMLHELAATAAERGQSEHAVLLSAAARSMEGPLSGSIEERALGLSQAVHAAAEHLDPAQARRVRDAGERLNRQQAIAAGLSNGE